LRGEKREIAEDVLCDALRLGFRIEELQVGDNLLYGVAAVAALDDFETGAVETKRFIAFDEQARVFFFVVDTATESKTGLRIGTGDHAKSFGDTEEFDSPAKQKGIRDKIPAVKKVSRVGKRRKKTVESC
jgi:hypothetical protein